MTPKIHRKGKSFFIQVRRPSWCGDVLFCNLPKYVQTIPRTRQCRIYGRTEAECMDNYRKFELRGINEMVKLKFLLTK